MNARIQAVATQSDAAQARIDLAACYRLVLRSRRPAAE